MKSNKNHITYTRALIDESYVFKSIIVDNILYITLGHNPTNIIFPNPSSLIISKGILKIFVYLKLLCEAVFTKQTSKGWDIIVAAITLKNTQLTLTL